MNSYPNLGAVRGREERVVRCAVETICLRENGTCLVPGRGQQWIAAVPMQESKRIVGRAAVRAGVAEPQIVTVDKGLRGLVSGLWIDDDTCTYVRCLVDSNEVVLWG